MMKPTALLLAAGLFTAAPAFAQAGAPAAEAETDIEVINGVPVNPELKAQIMDSEKARTVQELIELSNKVLTEQRDKAVQDRAVGDGKWMKQDPLGHLEGEMQELVMNIEDGDTAKSTQQRGQDVVHKMDALIAVMEKASSACSSCAGGGQGSKPGNGPGQGNDPAQDSTLAAGPGGSGDLSAKADGNNKYDDLDSEQREAILRAKNDQQGFPDEFDAVLDEYYRRLASERALETAEPTIEDE